MLATLDHPNILPLLEVGAENDVLYLVMPFYRRGTLHNLLKQCTAQLSLPEVERFLKQICAAVSYAHTRNIAHLDLKPQNILLHDDGRLVISDFGLAHIVQQGHVAGGSSLGAGTPQYMAPEHIQGKPGLQSDLYALGVILYQLLTNQLPFMSTLPAELESVVRKAMERKPEDRYATAEALLAHFHRAVSSALRQPAQPSVSGVFSPEAKPHIVDHGLLHAVLFSACVIAVFFAAPIGLSALIVGFLKKITHYENDDEMHFAFKALAVTVIAIIALALIFLETFVFQSCRFS